MASRHWEDDRREREHIVARIGLGQIIREVIIDRGHRNGPEIHMVTTTGLVIICNQRTLKVITVLIARPNQIRRYFKKNEVPKDIINLALQHTKAGYYKI